MQNLPWLGIAVIIHFGGLQFAKETKGATREIGVDHQVLQTHDETVASKHGHKPGYASGRNEFASCLTAIGQTQRCHIFH
jgi:hypothetical protein